MWSIPTRRPAARLCAGRALLPALSGACIEWFIDGHPEIGKAHWFSSPHTRCGGDSSSLLGTRARYIACASTTHRCCLGSHTCSCAEFANSAGLLASARAQHHKRAPHWKCGRHAADQAVPACAARRGTPSASCHATVASGSRRAPLTSPPQTLLPQLHFTGPPISKVQ